MDVGNFTKPSGKFLKAEDVEKSKTKIFSIISEATMVHNEKYDSDRLHIVGEMDATEFTFDCSKTNARVISATCGNDTKTWIGKQLKLETYRTKTSDGKMVSAINVNSIIA